MTSTTNTAISNEYYWANAPIADLPQVIRTKALAYRRRLETEGRLALQARADRTYYGLDGEGGWGNSAAVTYGGEDGEIVVHRVNHYRSIIQGLLAMSAKSRPAFECEAINDDSESLAEAAHINGIINGYYRERGLETVHVETDRKAIVLGEGFTALRWVPWLGPVSTYKEQPVLDEQGQPTLDEAGQPKVEKIPMRAGDVEVQSFAPSQIIRDLDASTSADGLTWAIVPYIANVWDLAARYPQKRDELLQMRGTAELWPTSACDGVDMKRPEEGSDSVTEWHVYHPPTDALPKGRMSIVVGDVVVFDGAFTLPEVPVYECIPEKEMGTSSGYSPQTDLLALQQVLDACVSVMSTNHDSFGLQNIWVPDGADITPEIISRGVRLLKGKAVENGSGQQLKPEVMQMLSMSKGSFDLYELYKSAMEVLSGINSVVRGDPMPQLKSGAALALVQSLAAQFNSQLQRTIVLHHERVATGLIRMLQAFAGSTPRDASVTSRARKAEIRQWSAETLKGIKRVTIQFAMGDTQSVRMALADAFLEKGLIKTTGEYAEVYETGRIRPTLESDEAAIMNIRQENEALSNGKGVILLPTDDHAIHILEHRAVIDNQRVRAKSPEIVKGVLAHIEEHMSTWLSMPPPMAMLTKQSLMPPPPPPMLPPGPGAPPPGLDGPPPPNGPPGDGKAQTTLTERARPLGGPPTDDMPLMPNNPLTGERAPA